MQIAAPRLRQELELVLPLWLALRVRGYKWGVREAGRAVNSLASCCRCRSCCCCCLNFWGVCAVIMRALCWIHNRYCMDMLGHADADDDAARERARAQACDWGRGWTRMLLCFLWRLVFPTFALCMNWTCRQSRSLSLSLCVPRTGTHWGSTLNLSLPLCGCLLLRLNCDNII